MQNNTDKRPDSQTVIEFHTNDDTNSSRNAHHHTLGPGPNQASPGSHVHDGNDSAQLIPGTAITGSRSGGGALSSVISLLTTLGAVDQTTA